MQTLHIRKLRARYRLHASARDERRRLDAALQAALGEPLEDELARLGFADDEEVCIRDVFAPVSLRLTATDAALARALSRALAEANWRALVEAALYVAGAPGASELLSQSALTANQSAALLTDGSATALANQSATPTEEQSTTPRANAPAATMREARRMVSTSRIARASASILAQSSMRREDVECAVAVLVILE